MVYHDQFVELLARGWTDEKLLRAYQDAIEEWQRVGHEGKPPIHLVVRGLLAGAADDILFDHDQPLS